MTDLLLTTGEAAAYLSIRERHVRELWQRRELPGYRLGRLVRFRRADLDLWAEANRVEARRGPLAGSRP